MQAAETSPIRLTTSRLLLRELGLEDCGALNEVESNPLVTRYMLFEPQTMEQTREYIEEGLRSRVEVPRKVYDFAIVPRIDGAAKQDDSPARLIGRCGFGVFRYEHKEAMLWYHLHPSYWGKGYASEAVAALFDFGFQTLGLHRIFADCDARNTPSCHVAEKVGMKLEGTLRENYFLKGEWCDSAMYGILDREWLERK